MPRMALARQGSQECTRQFSQEPNHRSSSPHFLIHPIFNTSNNMLTLALNHHLISIPAKDILNISQDNRSLLGEFPNSLVRQLWLAESLVL